MEAEQSEPVKWRDKASYPLAGTTGGLDIRERQWVGSKGSIARPIVGHGGDRGRQPKQAEMSPAEKRWGSVDVHDRERRQTRDGQDGQDGRTEQRSKWGTCEPELQLCSRFLDTAHRMRHGSKQRVSKE